MANKEKYSWDSLGKYIIIAIAIAIVGGILWYFRDIVIYILISVVLSLMGKPLVDTLSKVKLGKRHIPRWVSSTVTLVAMWAIVILLFRLIGPLVYEQTKSVLSENTLDIHSFVDKPLTDIDYFLEENNINANLSQHSESITAEIYKQFESLISLTLTGVGSILNFFVSLGIALFSITFITFFFLKEDSLFKNIVVNLFPDSQEAHAGEAIDKSIALLSKYFLGLLLETAVKTIVITIGIYAFGIGFGTALLVGLIAGVLNVIPYIGPLIGAIIGIFLTVTSTGVTPDMIYPLIWKLVILFAAFQLIDNLILQPYIYSNSVKAHPLEIFIVILLAGSIGGVLGMFLAVPAYTVLRVFAKSFLQNSYLVKRLTNKL